MCFCPPAERHLVRAVLLRRIQSDEPHVVHRLWSAGPGEPIRHLAHHAEHDRRSYLLCRFYWPRNSSDPVLGLLQAAVSGKGEKRRHLPSALSVNSQHPVSHRWFHLKEDARLLALKFCSLTIQKDKSTPS